MLGSGLHQIAALSVLGALSLGVVHGEEQRPLTEDAPAAPGSPPPPTWSRRPDPGRETRLSLHSDTRWPCTPLSGSRDVEISTQQDVCLSANFTLGDNVALLDPGYCPGEGRTPYLAIYPSDDCTGPYNHIDWFDRGHGGMMHARCISPAAFGREIEPPTGRWSIIFRCATARDAEGAPLTQPIFIPPPPPPPPKKPDPPYGSVSDSACFVRGLPAPRFLFQNPDADTCLSIAPRRQLKIYRAATCANGTRSLLARFEGDRCRGAPVKLEAVADGDATGAGAGETRLASCLDMGPDEWASYAFWCTGDVRVPAEPVPLELFPERQDKATQRHYCYGSGCRGAPVDDRPRRRSFSVWLLDFGVRKFLLVVALCIVGLFAVPIVAFRYGGKVVGCVKAASRSIFRKEGAIALK